MITADIAQIFSFTFNPYALLSLTGLIINIVLIYLITSRGLQNNANRWFTIFLSSIVLWAFSEFMGRISATPAAANFWGLIGAPGWVFLTLIFFTFTLAYIGKEDFLDDLARRIFLFGSGIFILFLVWTSNLISVHDHFNKVPWGWETPTGNYFWVFIIWLETFFIASLILLINYYRHTVDKDKKTQTGMLIIGVLIPLIGGSLTDALFPIINVHAPGSAILLTSVLGVISTYAILKYKLFVINPATHLGNIVQTMNEALMVFNLGDMVEFTNNAVSRLFGYSDSELAGRKIDPLIKDEKVLNSYKDNFRRPLFETGFTKGFEIDFYTKDNTRIPVSLAGSTLKDQNGSSIGYVVVATDMREMKKLVWDLTAERNKLSVTLAGIADGVFVVDKDGIISFFNPSAERIFNIRSEEVIGKNADIALNISDADGKIKVDYFFPKEKLSKDMITFSRNDVKIVRGGGETVFANLIAANIVEGEEINLGAIVTLHDISKEKDLEEMKLDFVSMAAHELRTPLTSIRGYLSVLQEELGKNIKPEQASFLDKAFISSTQLAALVENLLSVSRIERGSLQIQAQPFDWQAIVEEAYNNFLPQAKERKVELTYVKPKEKLPLVMVDKFRISEVISNLISNALNYTPAGGAVQVSLELGDHEILTHVSDTGQGIPAQAIPKLFTKFFRVSGVLEQGSKGTGLGLYISKSIVDMHKGRIWVESELGKGSVFSFSVPISKDQTPRTPLGAGATKGRRMFLRKKA